MHNGLDMRSKTCIQLIYTTTTTYLLTIMYSFNLQFMQ